jgi:DEAD/DEAH box helicase domain-containing protein
MAEENYIVFDVETQRSFEEVGGRQNMRDLGISVAVAYVTAEDSYRVYREADLAALVDLLRSTPLVVGFNIIGFDYLVLSRYTDFKLSSLPTCDLLADIYKQLGFRLRLDDVAMSTINTPKSADGLQAIQWYRDGKWDELIEYCTQDVKVTRDLFEFGREHGFVYFHDKYKKAKRKVMVNWQITQPAKG